MVGNKTSGEEIYSIVLPRDKGELVKVVRSIDSKKTFINLKFLYVEISLPYNKDLSKNLLKITVESGCFLWGIQE